jgi:hypothetical protein
MELPWEQETNTFILVHKIPEASKGVTWADDTMEMSSSASEFTDEQRSLDDIIEIKKKKKNSHKEKLVHWVRSHKCETIALVILVIGLILIPIAVLAYLRKNNSTTGPILVQESVNKQQTSSPATLPDAPVSTPATAPETIPTSPATNPTSPATIPTSPATIPTSITSTTSPVAVALPTIPGATLPPGATLLLRPQLVDELGDEINSLLEEPGSPPNMAYNWIMEQDEMRWDQEYPTMVQRFLLATFYFATGGRLTTASWHVCSAVPNNQLQGQTNTNAFATKCVSENEKDNDADTTTRVCAKFIDFNECPEYYERFELEAPSNPKKRWLSWTNECDWYGIVCDQQGLVTEISLPKNGLQGSLVSELSFLGRLTTLNLRENELGGTLPAWTGWNYLQHLSLSDNALEGTIPTEWQEWTWLETFELANNQVTGSLALPNNWINLKTVILGNNSLSIELSEELDTAHKLETLDLHGNALSSNLPLSLTNLKELMEFNVAGCGVVGTISSEFVNLPKLGKLGALVGRRMIYLYSDCQSLTFFALLRIMIILYSRTSTARQWFLWHDS